MKLKDGLTFYIKNEDGSYSYLGSKIPSDEFEKEPYVVEATSALEPFTASGRRKLKDFVDVEYSGCD